MSVIDDHIKSVEPAKRVELERIRRIAHEELPGAEEIISYGMPSIRYKGVTVIGFDAHKSHVGIYPYSGRIIRNMRELDEYKSTPGAIQEKLDHLLPEELIRKLIRERLTQDDLA
jgi:uncharacterized protein YdhG (YjbR/CyaY superfamily)